VVAQAGTTADALAIARTTLPDLVLIDAHLPDGSGITTCRAIRAAPPNARVVILAGYADTVTLSGWIEAGALGLLLKDRREGDLVAEHEALVAGASRPERPSGE
jgi:two-component system, NarL family, response regulator DevR